MSFALHWQVVSLEQVSCLCVFPILFVCLFVVLLLNSFTLQQ